MSAPGVQPSQVYLGWQHTLLYPEPGPPPRRPVPPDPQQLNPGWLAAQRREELLLSRPFMVAAAASVTWLALLTWVSLADPGGRALAALVAVVLAGVAGLCGREIWRGRLDLRGRVEAEGKRAAAVRASQESDLFAAQEDHARRFRAWQAHEQAFARQPRWYPVALPAGIDRVDVVGGTLAGWSALFTTIAAPRLAAGGEVTVIDLSEGAVAADLVRLAENVSADPLVWVLPTDLPRFDLGVGLPSGELADVLTASVSACAGAGERDDTARDHALLERLCDVFGDGARISQITAGLRALGQVGDARDDIRQGRLTIDQLERITALYGRGAAEHVVIERAWTLEARLRMLEPLGEDPADLPLSKLRVVAMERGAGAFGNAVLGTYVVVSLTHLLRQAPPGRPWRHTLCVAGAEKLDGDVVDLLTQACESTKTGLVLACRSVPASVRERLGRGDAALAVMRLGNAEDAKAVSEQIGSEHRFVVSQLTDTVGASVTDTVGDSYTSTVGTADSWSGSDSVSHTTGRSQGRGQSQADAAPFGSRTGSRSHDRSESAGDSQSASITAGINDATSWGVTTSRAIGVTESLARTAQRAREFLVEPHELQQLPASAVLVSYASERGRQLLLADANPAIMTLPTVTMRSPEETRRSLEAEERDRMSARAAADFADVTRASAGGRAGDEAGVRARGGAWAAGGTRAQSAGRAWAAGPAQAGGPHGAGGGMAAGWPLPAAVGGPRRADGRQAESWREDDVPGGRPGAWGGHGWGPGLVAGDDDPHGFWSGDATASSWSDEEAGGFWGETGEVADAPDVPGVSTGEGPGPDDSASGRPDGASATPPRPVSWRTRGAQPPPNLGPPPRPLDWRKRNRRS